MAVPPSSPGYQASRMALAFCLAQLTRQRAAVHQHHHQRLAGGLHGFERELPRPSADRSRCGRRRQSLPAACGRPSLRLPVPGDAHDGDDHIGLLGGGHRIVQASFTRVPGKRRARGTERRRGRHRSLCRPPAARRVAAAAAAARSMEELHLQRVVLALFQVDLALRAAATGRIQRNPPRPPAARCIQSSITVLPSSHTRTPPAPLIESS